jgi:hypothetical protein
LAQKHFVVQESRKMKSLQGFGRKFNVSASQNQRWKQVYEKALEDAILDEARSANEDYDLRKVI